jgi:hypothetical protein
MPPPTSTPGRPSSECGQPLPPDPAEGTGGRPRQFHRDCAAARTLRLISERRKEAKRLTTVKRSCAICGMPFVRKNGPQVYCSHDCSVKGLQAAFERAKVKRRLDRQAKKAPAPVRLGEHETETATDAGVGDGRKE